MFYTSQKTRVRSIRLLLVKGALFLSFAFWVGCPAYAQFLKLGPFDIDASAGVDAIYSSNVDGVRPADAKDRMEDYYLVGRFGVVADAELGKHIRLNSKVTLEEERHFIRKDLDDRTRSDPLGLLALATDMDFGRYALALFYNHESTYEKKEGQFVEGPRTKRTYRRTDSYGARLSWRRGRWDWVASINGDRDRYVEDEFKDGDQDSLTMDFNISWQVTKRIATFYGYDRRRKKLLNQPGSFDGWDEKHRVGTSVLLLKRPSLTYAFAMEKQSAQGEDFGWQPTHTFSVADSLDLTKTLKLSGDATYSIKEDRGVNDIAFTYGATLDHEIARTARQSLRATREPADTFGSTVDTDSTMVGYSFTKNDLFIYNLVLTLRAEYRHDKPLSDEDGESETIWSYIGDLKWTRKVSRKVDRIVNYNYRRENSNRFDEDLEEHRVTVSYNYTF